jgi:hypothetical protein
MYPFSNTGKSNPVMVECARGVYTEQLAYYKEKNTELKDRIDSHIRLNKELKEKLEGLSRGGEDYNTLEFYRVQAANYEK